MDLGDIAMGFIVVLIPILILGLAYKRRGYVSADKGEP